MTRNVNRIKTTYKNSGDWIENFTALEYQFKRWRMYSFDSVKLKGFSIDDDDDDEIKLNDLIAAVIISDLES
jgi:hypothetical protein